MVVSTHVGTTHSAENRRGYSTELLTRISVSMTSLHICKLVSLVTSRNRSRVSFLIWKDFTGKASEDGSALPPSHLATLHAQTEQKMFIQCSWRQSAASLYKSNTILLPFNKAIPAKADSAFGTQLWPEAATSAKVEMAHPDPAQADHAAGKTQVWRSVSGMQSQLSQIWAYL